MSDKYLQRGVSASKEDVHAAIKNLDKGLFPGSFCKLFPDYLHSNNDFVIAMSSDGSGTKSILAYLYWKETGDLSVWKGIAQDAMVMNTDDLMCVGATGNFLFSSVLNRNKKNIPGEVIKAIIEGSHEFCEMLLQQGIAVHFTGGETADLGDIVRTITVDASMTARISKKNLIITKNIKPGQVIIGLASDGQTSYESNYNSGIGSNGLTSARHDVLSKFYGEKYPETFEPSLDKNLVYCGSKKLTDPLEGTALNVGQALLSPTRTYLPIIKKIIEEKPAAIKGLINNTGGALSKVLHYVSNVKLVKNNIPSIPPVFELIKKESKIDNRELFKVLNCGIRVEIYTEEHHANEIMQIAKSFGNNAFIMGHVEASENPEVIVNYHGEEWSYCQ